MKKILSAVLLTTLACGAIPVSAKQEKIVVSASPVDLWKSAIGRNLDRELGRIDFFDRHGPVDGIVQVRFECDETGKPANLAVIRKSGNSVVDRQVVRAVSRLTTLHPLPEGISHGQLFQANVILASDRKRYERLSRQLKEEEAERLAASSSHDRRVVALSLTQGPALK